VSTVESNTPPSHHIRALDGIRALAILLVIPHNVDVLTRPYPAYDYPIAMLMHAGWIGVQLFFVLSGFLITGNLLATRGAANYFATFFGRRALRIMPLYFAVLLFSFTLAPAFFALPDTFLNTRSHQLWLWTFLSNWTTPFDQGVFGFSHFWSLAVEEQFYLVWPFIVLRCKPSSLLWVCATAVVGALLARGALFAAHLTEDVRHDAIYMFTITRMDALTLGAAGAALIRIPAAAEWLRHRGRQVAWAAALTMLATILVTRGFGIYDVSTQSVGYTLLSTAFALLVLWAALPATGSLRAAQRILESTPLRLVGRYSYGMYVFRLPLHVFVTGPLLHRLTSQVTPGVALTYVMVMLLATFALAALSYELFERRFLDLKRYLVPAGPTARELSAQ